MVLSDPSTQNNDLEALGLAHIDKDDLEFKLAPGDLHPGEWLLCKTSQGRLIHVSSFINKEDGQLVFLGENGKIICDV